jgi:hypothetical protein
LNHKKNLESKQANLPLGSKENYYEDLVSHFTKKSNNHKCDILVHGKQITLTVEKGTKRISYFLNPSLPVEKTTKHDFLKSHVCSTCKEVITDISRVLIMRDKDGGPRLLCFHFFYPCWDMELLCQQYPNLVIEKTSFSIPENMSLKPSSIESLQTNQDLWI